MQLYTDRPNLARESREMLPGTLDMPSRVDVGPGVAAWMRLVRAAWASSVRRRAADWQQC